MKRWVKHSVLVEKNLFIKNKFIPKGLRLITKQMNYNTVCIKIQIRRGGGRRIRSLWPSWATFFLVSHSQVVHAFYMRIEFH